MKEQASYGAVLKEVGTSAKGLIESEVDLVKAELKDTGDRLQQHTAQAAIFGALLAISVFPFLAFLVIGLGRLLNDQYWLSSLIIAVVCAAVGGSMTYSAYKKISQEDLTLPRTRESLEHNKEVIENATRRVA